MTVVQLDLNGRTTLVKVVTEDSTIYEICS